MSSLETVPVGWHFATEAGDEAMTARKFASVKFPDTFVENARREAALFNRSVAGQIEHWARLGRALEGTPEFSTERVRATLMGRLKIEDLNAAERRAVLDGMFFWAANPSAEETEAYAALARRPGAVGTDGEGGIVRSRAKAKLKTAS